MSRPATAKDTNLIRAHVLVVEDDPSVAEGLVRGLKQAGFEVTLASRGDRALETAERDGVDLMVLDLNLPGASGFEVLDALRSRQSLPVIVLTARTELQDRLRAFDLGAADYLAKPFWMEELVARIRSRLRLPAQADRREVGWDDVVCDLDGRSVRRQDGQDLGLTAHEFNVLALLLERRGNALTRDQIAERALPFDGDRQTRTVDSHVSHLRRKLGPAGVRIRTVWGIGYRFDLEDAG
jgi:DNA-binding response OmpR family regulator